MTDYGSMSHQDLYNYVHSGDPSTVQAQADDTTQHSKSVTEATQELQTTLAGIQSSWSGAAADQFSQQANTLVQKMSQHASDADAIGQTMNYASSSLSWAQKYMPSPPSEAEQLLADVDSNPVTGFLGGIMSGGMANLASEAAKKDIENKKQAATQVMTQLASAYSQAKAQLPQDSHGYNEDPTDPKNKNGNGSDPTGGTVVGAPVFYPVSGPVETGGGSAGNHYSGGGGGGGGGGGTGGSYNGLGGGGSSTGGGDGQFYQAHPIERQPVYSPPPGTVTSGLGDGGGGTGTGGGGIGGTGGGGYGGTGTGGYGGGVGGTGTGGVGGSGGGFGGSGGGFGGIGGVGGAGGFGGGAGGGLGGAGLEGEGTGGSGLGGAGGLGGRAGAGGGAGNLGEEAGGTGYGAQAGRGGASASGSRAGGGTSAAAAAGEAEGNPEQQMGSMMGNMGRGAGAAGKGEQRGNRASWLREDQDYWYGDKYKNAAPPGGVIE